MQGLNLWSRLAQGDGDALGHDRDFTRIVCCNAAESLRGGQRVKKRLGKGKDWRAFTLETGQHRGKVSNVRGRRSRSSCVDGVSYEELWAAESNQATLAVGATCG